MKAGLLTFRLGGRPGGTVLLLPLTDTAGEWIHANMQPTLNRSETEFAL